MGGRDRTLATPLLDDLSTGDAFTAPAWPSWNRLVPIRNCLLRSFETVHFFHERTHHNQVDHTANDPAALRRVAVGQISTTRATLTADAVLHVPGSHPAPGDHRGRGRSFAFVAPAARRPTATEQIDLVEPADRRRARPPPIAVTGSRGDRPATREHTVHLMRSSRDASPRSGSTTGQRAGRHLLE